MSAFRALRAAHAPRLLRPAQRSALHARAALRAGGESNIHHENRAEELERLKQEQLAEHKQGKGEWKHELASDSESAVAADRNGKPASKEDIKDLQDKSADAAQKKHGQK